MIVFNLVGILSVAVGLLLGVGAQYFAEWLGWKGRGVDPLPVIGYIVAGLSMVCGDIHFRRWFPNPKVLNRLLDYTSGGSIWFVPVWVGGAALASIGFEFSLPSSFIKVLPPIVYFLFFLTIQAVICAVVVKKTRVETAPEQPPQQALQQLADESHSA